VLGRVASGGEIPGAVPSRHLASPATRRSRHCAAGRPKNWTAAIEDQDDNPEVTIQNRQKDVFYARTRIAELMAAQGIDRAKALVLPVFPPVSNPKFHGRINDFPHAPADDSVETKTVVGIGEPKSQLLSLIGPRRPPRILRPHCDPSLGQPARRWLKFGGLSKESSVIPIDPNCTICAVPVRNGVKSRPMPRLESQPQTMNPFLRSDQSITNRA